MGRTAVDREDAHGAGTRPARVGADAGRRGGHRAAQPAGGLPDGARGHPGARSPRPTPAWPGPPADPAGVGLVGRAAGLRLARLVEPTGLVAVAGGEGAVAVPAPAHLRPGRLQAPG